MERFVNAHYCTCIFKIKRVLVTVVWRTPQCDQLPFCEELVSIFNNFVASNNEIHVVLLQPSRDDIGTEREADTSVTLRPPGNISIWVAPKQIAEKTTVRYLSSITSQQAGQRER